ncbi:MAG: S9 family peptidase [Gemmatimonadota bacterium]|nr:S9 family peptidase [Gemmatimonadota bacterium]MDE3004986.1 S9 family peptidase [Gemmatimonadota bacterium]MDE3013274.1 S9 family peptidase [Gemmatimonadota bacterium]
MKSRMSLPSAALTAVVALTWLGIQSPIEGQETVRLSLDHYMDLETVSGPQISPDGSRVVYTRSWFDMVNDRRESSIWIMETDGSRNRHLLEGAGVRWSPDGTRILFTAPGEPGGAQIHVRWMDAEGATSQVTRLDNGPGNVRWSPDGDWIAFTSRVDDRADFAGVSLPDRPDGAQWTAGPKIVERAGYKRDRSGYVDTGWTHLFVVPAEGGTPRQLTRGDWNHNGIAWSPDGTEIYFTSYRTEDWDAPENWQESDIYAVEVVTGSIRRLTDKRGADGSPVPSPDGSLIAYISGDEHADTYRNSRIHVMNRDGSGQRSISGDYDRQSGGLMWAPDGSGLYFSVSREGYRSLHFASVDGGVERRTEGSHLMTLSSFSDEGMAVGTISSAYEPGDLYRWSLDNPEDPIRLTNVNADILHNVTLGEVEEIWYPSDPFDIQGWIVKPPDFDPNREYPLMLAIHGGPHGMYNGGFNFAFQEHASNDYVVLYTNPRGSTGYGTEFANAIQNDYPGVDMQDLMRGVDYMLETGYIDEENLFVYGCSGGGILTTYIVGNTDRFTAASANCPIVNWMSAMGTSDAISYTRTFEVPFWEDPTEWIDRSSIFYVGNVTTPTMLMTGELDLRTPMGQTEEYYQALQYVGVPTVMVRFQDEWHGTGSRPSNFMRTQLYLRKWWEKWGTHDDRPVS